MQFPVQYIPSMTRDCREHDFTSLLVRRFPKEITLKGLATCDVHNLRFALIDIG